MVVDDHPDILEVLTYNLTKVGYAVHPFDGAEGALAYLRDAPVDLVVTDLMMDGMDGIGLCRHLRSNPITSQIPVLMISVKNDEANRSAALEHGVNEYLPKPFRMQELIGCLDRMLILAEPASPAVLRPKETPAEHMLRRGPLQLDLPQRLVYLAGREVQLAPSEYRLLKLLVLHPGRLFSAEEMSDRLSVSGLKMPAMQAERIARRLQQALVPSPLLVAQPTPFGLSLREDYYRFDA